MYRQQLDDKYSPYHQSRPRNHNNNSLLDENNQKPIVSEWKFAVSGLILSLLVIIAKLYYANLDYLKETIFEQHLISYETLNENGDVMLKFAWKSAIKYSNVWIPGLFGLCVTYFTWMMVYLDSHVPGVQPPSPFSPTKFKTRSGHSFHLNYIFAVFIGFMVALYMYWRNVSIEY